MEGNSTYMECKRILATTCNYTIFFSHALIRTRFLRDHGKYIPREVFD